MNRIILVGPSASGKNYLRDKLSDRGFSFDVSYTTREIRTEVGEQEGVEYHYISFDDFQRMEDNDELYEKTTYNGNKYGTGKKEWNDKDVFIMEPYGVSCITEEDRKNCFIIYIDPPVEDRVNRMRDIRNWNDDQVKSRLVTDDKKFSDFDNYDIKITTPEF